MKLLGGGGERGSSRGVGLILLLFLSSHLILLIPADQETTMCVQIGQASPNAIFTIGAQPFDSQHLQRLLPSVGYPPLPWSSFLKNERGHPNYDNMGCPQGFAIDFDNPAVTYINWDFCPTDIQIRAYLVRQNGKVLNGWLHFEVELIDDAIDFIYVQTRDEVFNAIGEFVVNEDEQCIPSKHYLLSPTKYQFLPCSATGAREAKTSGAIYMANYWQYRQPYRVLQEKGYIPTTELKRGIHFTWRLNEYWCNRHQKFRLDAIVWKTHSRIGINHPDRPGCGYKDKNCLVRRKHASYWIWPKWFGAADIKIEGELDCATPAIDYNTGVLTPEAGAWIRKSSLMTRGEDYTNLAGGYKHNGKQYLKGCQVDPYLGWYAPTFGGRCKNHYYKVTSREQLQSCNTDENAAEFQGLNIKEFVVYSTYVDNINEKRLKQCDQKCEEPDSSNPAHLTEIQSYPRGRTINGTSRSGKLSLKTIREARYEVRDTTFWQTRKFHGNICIFLTMFFIPVSNFLIRYYKETFMKHLSLGCAPWFWFHLFVCFAVPSMYRSSWVAMQQNIDNYGTSQTPEANIHRLGGRIFIWVFILMVLLGSIRPVAPRLRILTMALHAVTGFSIYFLAIFLVINSTFIPASPTLHECDEEGLPTGFSFTAKMTVAWFIIDSLFHILLTGFQIAIDKKHQIKRSGFGLPIVPMLPAEAWNDLRGASFRKIILVVYVSVALVMAFTTIGVNFRRDDHQNCKLGVMSCNLEEVRPNMESSPFGCLTVSLRYYAKVSAKYSINYTQSE